MIKLIVFDLINTLIHSSTTENKMEFFPEALPTVKKLHQKGFQLAILSNSHRSVTDSLSRQHPGWLDYFDFIHLSSQTGYTKPDPQAFTNLIAEVDIPPEQILMVGDGQHKDVEAARQAGMQGLLFTNYEQLHRDLTEKYFIEL